MYQEHFGLVAEPFDLNTNPRFLYLSPEHARARAYLDYAVYKGDSMVVITGEIGIGKSTLVHDLIDRIDNNSKVVVLHHPHADPVEFLQAVLLEFGNKNLSGTKTELLEQVRAEVAARFVCGTRTTLIVDEAQTLTRNVLEELRMLADDEINSEKPLGIVLVGQPCLSDNLSGRDMEQFRQRIRLTFHLSALDIHETKGYIDRRLGVAGADMTKIFCDETIPRIYKYTGGVPRLINVLADLSLTAAWMDGSRLVTADLVNDAIKELGWMPYSKRVRHLPEIKTVAIWNGRIRGYTDRTNQYIQRLAKASRTSMRHMYAGTIAGAGRAQKLTWTPFHHWLKNDVRPALGQRAHQISTASSDAWKKIGNSATVSLHSLEAWMRDQRVNPTWHTHNGLRGAAVGFVLAMLLSVLLFRPQGPLTTDETMAAVSLTDSAFLTTPIVAHTLPFDVLSSEDRAPLPVMPLPPTPITMPASLEMFTVESDVFPAEYDVSDGQPAFFDVLQGHTVAASYQFQQAPSTAVTGLKFRGLQPASWVLDQSSDSYIIQILAAKKPEVVERFLQGPIAEMEIAYYHRQRNDETWYVLVSGVYPSYNSAKQASKKLPKQALQARPWVRPILAVQNDIREAQENAMLVSQLQGSVAQKIATR